MALRSRLRALATTAALLLAAAAALPAQAGAQAGVPTGKLRLFLDCAMHCDRSYLRTEVTVVDWVTDREAADVHVIATDLRTGAGGQLVTLEFLGRGALDSLRDHLQFSTAPDATDDDTRHEFARVLRLGLVRYILASGRGSNLSLLQATSGPAAPRSPVHDAWNNWVFRVGLDGSLDAQTREQGGDLSAEMRANRTTDEWKIELGLDGDISRTTYEFDDGTKFTARRDGWSADGLAVRSVGRNWSVGGLTELRSRQTQNLDLSARVGLAVERDFFPYAEATRRRLILLYSVAVTHYDYVEPTIFDRVTETRPNHQLQLAYGSEQPWGSARLQATAFSYLHDWSRNRLSIGGSIGVRLARGLAVDLRGSYSRIRDQLSIPKGDASDEEVLLELRQLATGYRASMRIGVSYTFGSFLNSVVNPRLDDLD
ncbi:MAG: hypothetical protein V4503_01545 [Gemmatimonadota bacterium]